MIVEVEETGAAFAFPTAAGRASARSVRGRGLPNPFSQVPSGPPPPGRRSAREKDPLQVVPAAAAAGRRRAINAIIGWPGPLPGSIRDGVFPLTRDPEQQTK